MLLRAALKAQIYFVSHRFLDEKFPVLGWHRNHDETRIKLTRPWMSKGRETTMAQSRHTLGTHSTLYKARNPYYARIIRSFTARGSSPLPCETRHIFRGKLDRITSYFPFQPNRGSLFFLNDCTYVFRIIRKSEGNVIAGGSETIILLLIKELWRCSRKIST